MKNLINEAKRMQQLAGLITESQLNEVDQLAKIRQLVREVINEYETSEIIPGITINDEGEYNIDYGMGLNLYDNYLKGKTTVGDLVYVLKEKGIPEKQAIDIAFAIEDKYSKTYSKGSKGKRF